MRARDGSESQCGGGTEVASVPPCRCCQLDYRERQHVPVAPEQKSRASRRRMRVSLELPCEACARAAATRQPVMPLPMTTISAVGGSAFVALRRVSGDRAFAVQKDGSGSGCGAPARTLGRPALTSRSMRRGKKSANWTGVSCHPPPSRSSAALPCSLAGRRGRSKVPLLDSANKRPKSAREIQSLPPARVQHSNCGPARCGPQQRRTTLAPLV